MNVFASVLLVFAPALASGSGDDHGHGNGLWEWAGAFALSSEHTYTLTFRPREPAIQFLYVPASTADAAGIEEVEAAATTIWNTTAATQVSGTDTPLAPSVRYNLTLEEDSYINIFWLQAAVTARSSGLNREPHVLFFEHLPGELEKSGLHWLKDDHGGNVEPRAFEPPEPEPEEADGHTGMAILACIVVTCISAVGLLFIVPCIKLFNIEKSEENFQTFLEIGNAFASGALLSCMSFLMFPEALLLSTDGSGKQTGAMLLLGFISVGIVNWICNCAGGRHGIAHGHGHGGGACDDDNCGHSHGKPAAHGHGHGAGAIPGQVPAEQEQASLKDGDQDEDLTPAAQPAAGAQDDDDHGHGHGHSNGCCNFESWEPVAFSVLFGDFLHNFVDGIAIGVAFRYCEGNGWVVAGGAIAHEFSQELADFIVLVTQGKLTIPEAIGANLLSGCSCIIGGILASYIKLSAGATSCLLAYGGGTYLWIGTVECFPCLMKERKPIRILSLLFAFLFGVLLIHLALLNHEHCDPDGAHAGHDH